MTNKLQEVLATFPRGPITHTGDLDRYLADAWNEFSGDHGGMEGRKLLGRMEDVAWNPPLLTFTVERHGGTLQGSTRAELQRWTVDVGQGKTTCESGGYRQLYGRQAPFDIEALAEDIVTLIVTRQPDDRLRWCADEKVLVLMGMVLPNQSAVKQTLTGRRKRLRAALKEHLAGKGWAEVKPNLWKRGGCVP